MNPARAVPVTGLVAPLAMKGAPGALGGIGGGLANADDASRYTKKANAKPGKQTSASAQNSQDFIIVPVPDRLKFGRLSLEYVVAPCDNLPFSADCQLPPNE